MSLFLWKSFGLLVQHLARDSVFVVVDGHANKMRDQVEHHRLVAAFRLNFYTSNDNKHVHHESPGY